MEISEYKQLLKDIQDSLLKDRDQEVVRLWQRVINLENRLSGYDATFNNLNLRLDAHGKEANSTIVRIMELEEARKKQIALNSQLLNKAKIAVDIKPEFKPEIKVDTSWISKLFKK